MVEWWNPLSWFQSAGQQTFQNIITPVSPASGTVGASVATAQQATRPQTAVQQSAPSPTITVPIPEQIHTAVAQESPWSSMASFLKGSTETVSSQISNIFRPIIETPQAQAVIKAVTTTAAPAQVPQTSSDMSQFSRDIYGGASRVAAVIGTGMGIADIGARRIERALPGGFSELYSGTYELGKGIFLSAPKATVETAGMIPGGVETLARNVPLVPAFAAAGVLSQVSGLQEGFSQRPLQTIGELIGMGAMGEGVSLGTVRGFRAVREAIPYDISIGKPAGVLVDIGKIYSPKVETPGQIPGLVPRVTEVAPENIATFASRPAEGLSNVYVRLTQEAIGKVQAQAIVGKPEYVSTDFGSYMKLSIKDIRETSPFKSIEGAPEQFRFSSLFENLPVRIERRLEMFPTELKLSEPKPARAQIPEITYDVDVYPEGYTMERPYRGEGTVPGEFGGIVLGAAEKQMFPITEQVKTLYPRAARPLPESMEVAPEFKTMFKSTEEILSTKATVSENIKLADFVKSALKEPEITNIEAESTMIDTGRIQSSIKPSIKLTTEKTLSETLFETPQFKTEAFVSTRRQVSVVEREPISDSLKNLFSRTATEMKTSVEATVKINDIVAPTNESTEALFYSYKTPLSPEKIISADSYFQSGSKTIRDTSATIFISPKPSAKEIPSPFVFQSPREFPAPYPDPYPDISPFPYPQPSPYKQPRPTTKPDEIPERLFEFRFPIIPPIKLLPTKFDEYRQERKRKSTRRKITAYQIRNPLADLEDVLGVIDADIRKEINPSKKKRKSK